MKTLFYLFIAIAFLNACKKNNTSKTQYNLSNQDPLKTTSGTWVLYKYQTQNGTAMTNISDTLIFSSNNKYTYNGQSSDYFLSSSGLYYSYRLSLYNTAFGYITGIIPSNFESTKEINGVEFSNLQSSGPTNGKYTLWLRQI